MNLKLIATLIFCICALDAGAAMLRVLGVENGSTIVVERNGRPARVTLAGVAITDEPAAKALLQWTLTSGTAASAAASGAAASQAAVWILLEERPGGALVYRSPDALFLNRELVQRGFARATLSGIEPRSHVPVTFLGTIDPISRPSAVRRSAPAGGSGSGSSRRRPAPRRRSR